MWQHHGRRGKITGFGLAFLCVLFDCKDCGGKKIFVLKHSCNWLSPETRKDGLIMYYDLVESGKRIKNLRKEKGLSQNALAETLGIHVKTVSKAERGIIGLSVDNLIQISSYFNVSLDYLILGQNKELNIFDRIALQPEDKRKRIERIITEMLEL